MCNKLKKNDLVLSAHRSHAHYLAKGGDLNKMIAEIQELVRNLEAKIEVNIETKVKLLNEKYLNAEPDAFLKSWITDIGN